LNGLAILAGVAVFIAAEIDGLELARLFAGRALSLASMIGATLILIPLWIAVGRNAVQIARIAVAAQGGLVLIGWFRLQFPVIINSESVPLTIYTSAAPEPTLRYLLYALIGGSAVVLPAFVYLLVVFKAREADELAEDSP
jgi:cytochrome bd-type quinol oxidase subunit 2